MIYAKIQNVDTAGYERIIAVSDIHGNGHLLDRLLMRLNFCEKDALILLGDYIERGKNSLATLRFVMELCKNENVFALMGNCDTLWDDLMNGLYGVDVNAYINWRKNSLLEDMCSELGIDRIALGTGAVTRALEANYGALFSWLRALPHIIDTPQAVFVHAGIDAVKPLEAQSAERVLKRTAFLEEGQCLKKTVVCGHIPTSNYFLLRDNMLSYLPLEVGNAICIDGGNAVKIDGQLNALIIEKGETDCIFEDDLIEVAVCGKQARSKAPSSVAWNHKEITLIECGKDTSRCIVKATGRPLVIPNDYLHKSDGVTVSEDYTDFEPELAPGERVKLIEKGEKRSLIKKDGVRGWADNSLLTLT